MRWKRRDGVMNAGARRVQRVYLLLLLLHTLAASFIWGINTLFLLDAGLTNTQAFAANACFTAGLVLFEVPTGVVADLRGRRLSYLLGTLTLALSTLLYLLMWRISAPFWAWALASALLMPYFDQEFGEELDRLFSEKFDLLLGRKTYEMD
jgi:MFS family permease